MLEVMVALQFLIFFALPTSAEAEARGAQGMMPLRQIADFLRGIRIERRFGEISRSPLKLLRFQVQGERAEVEWLARSAG